MIPLVNLKSQYRSIKPEIDHAIQKILDETSFIKGPYLKEFEENFAKVCDAKHCIGVSSGTNALDIVLRGLGIGEGDEVMLPVNTFISTLEAVVMLGAKPVFVDCDKTSTMCIDDLQKKITNKTRLILPVHLYGRSADMDAIKEIADAHGSKIVEDCAQSHLAEYKGKKTPVYGVGCFSFYPGNNLGAYGDAGGVVTNDDALALKIRKLIDHGRIDKYRHDVYGFNYRMDALQAAVLNVKLKHVDEWTEKRRKLVELYTELLQGVCDLPVSEGDRKHVYHLYVIQVDKREKLQKFLQEKGIASGLHYPIPLHLQPACKHLGYRFGDFPEAERQADRILSLPLCSELSEENVTMIAGNVKEFLGK